MVLTMKTQNLQQKMVCYWQWIKRQLFTPWSNKIWAKWIESSLYDYFDAYILVTGNITVAGGNINTKVAFKNCAQFKECRTNKWNFCW